MTYLMILLAVGLVLSPLLALAPSPRQRQQQRLRERAMQRGLQVQFSGSDDVGQRTRAISYRLPLGPELHFERLLAAPVVFERVNETDWHCLNPAGCGLEPLLAALPGDVFRVLLASRRLSVDWYERGDGEAVDRIADSLESLRDALAGKLADAPAAGYDETGE